MTRLSFPCRGRSSHSSRNTPCGISLGRCSPRYLLFCSIILARQCVLPGRNRRSHRKLSHVRDKRARAILRRSVRHALKKKCMMPLRCYGTEKHANVRIPNTRTYTHAHKRIPPVTVYLFIYLSRWRRRKARGNTLFLGLGLDCPGLTCSTSVI